MGLILTKNIFRKFIRLNFGINKHVIYKILCSLGINVLGNNIDKNWNKISNSDYLLFVQYIERFFLIESSLKGIIFSNIRKYRVTKSYKGSRYFYGLPANGQRTKTNARTCKRFNKIKKSLNISSKSKKPVVKGKKSNLKKNAKNKATVKKKSGKK